MTQKGERKGKGKGIVKHCFRFLLNGKCDTQGCTYPHLTQSQLDAELAKLATTRVTNKCRP